MKNLKQLAYIGLVIAISACSESDDNWQHPTEVEQTEKVLTFPHDFKWSAGTSHLQHDGLYWKEGRGASNFAEVGPALSMGENLNIVNDLNNHWQQDIADLAEAGLDNYRFSLDWAWLIPTGDPSQVNPVALEFYHNYIDELVANGISPDITLYHYDMPAGLALPKSVLTQVLPDLAYLGLGNGFNNRLTAMMWLGYAQVAFANFGDRVGHWYTFNEIVLGIGVNSLISDFVVELTANPNISIDELLALQFSKSTSDRIGENLDTIHNMLWANASAKAMALQMGVQGKVGLINTFIKPKVTSSDPKDIEAARLFSLLNNDMISQPLSQGSYPQEILDIFAENGHEFTFPRELLQQELEFIRLMGTDFAAINYYNRPIVNHDLESPFGDSSMYDDVVLSVFDFYRTNQSTPSPTLALPGYDPEGLYETVMWMSDNLPEGTEIIISENGAAPIPKGDNILLTGGVDKLTEDGKVHDPQRIDYIQGHLSAIHKAIQDGANVTMYSAWSMWDLWEFTRFSNTFGLIYVDYDDPARTRYKKDSYYWYQDVVTNNRVNLD